MISNCVYCIFSNWCVQQGLDNTRRVVGRRVGVLMTGTDKFNGTSYLMSFANPAANPFD
jgi:hypothetical protein